MKNEQAMSRKVARIEQATSFPGDYQVIARNLVILPGKWKLTDPFLVFTEDWYQSPGGYPLHWHWGIEMITLVLEGHVEHHNSQGIASVLSPGDMQWVTSGSGILHQEMAYEKSTAHTLQLWLNLPESKKKAKPRYQGLQLEEIPVRRETGGHIRVLSGQSGPIASEMHNHWPVTALDIRLSQDAAFVQDIPCRYRAFLYVLGGTATIGPEESTIAKGEIAWFDPTDSEGFDEISICSKEQLHGIFFASEPMGEPILSEPPFGNGKNELKAGMV